MKHRVILSWIAILFTALIGLRCDDNDGAGMARLEVRLTDAPGNYEAVWVDIQDVQVKASDDNSENGWISLDIDEGKYDLIKLTDGLDTLLGTSQLPAGRLSQIRLVLGDDNTVVVDGETYDLNTPSAQQSGLKIQINADLEADQSYTVLLDFDAARSVVSAGSGKYNLKPVIRANVEVTENDVDEDETGIKGKIDPASSNSVIYAIIGEDSTSTQADAVTGNFLIGDLTLGTYKISIVPGEEYEPKEISDVQVLEGEITDLGTITLEH
jgi:hypothetical protein